VRAVKFRIASQCELLRRTRKRGIFRLGESRGGEKFTMLDKEAMIRERAYALWLAAGCPVGQDQDHWYQAVFEVTNDEIAEANPVKRVKRVLRSAAAVPAKKKK
jgi:hypothetical protein